MLVEPREKSGIKHWYYCFSINKKKYRGWLLPVEQMSKRQAIAELDRIKARIITGDSPITKENKKISVKNIFDDYENYLKEHKKSTWENMKYLYSNLKFFHTLTSINHDDIVEYQKKRKSAEVQGTSINRELNMAKAAFNRAIKHRKWNSLNPFQFYDKYPDNQRTRYLTQQELANLLAATKIASNDYNPHISDIVLLAIFLGFRKDKILKMHIRNFNEESSTYRIKGEGTVKYMEDHVTHVPKIAADIIKRLAKDSKSGYLFENPRTGKPYDGIKKTWASALSLAGISDFHFHDLKHTFATYALLATRDLKSVQETIGHSDIKMTSKYAHVLNERKVEVMTLTESFISTLMDKKMDKSEIE